MTIALAPTQQAVLKALGAVLTGMLPSGIPIFVGQSNRVPEPKTSDFVIMTPVRRERIETNVDSGADVCFTGSIAGTTLTVSAIPLGAIAAGATLFGSGVADNSSIVSQLSGPAGGVGTYKVAPTQAAPSQKMASGATQVLQPTNIVVQLDVHGPNGADNAQKISTLFRDDYAVQQFAKSGIDVSPLLAEDPKQLPFLNAEQQYEDRWVLEAQMQVNEIVTFPQQFADALDVDLVDVDAVYPPA